MIIMFIAIVFPSFTIHGCCGRFSIVFLCFYFFSFSLLSICYFLRHFPSSLPHDLTLPFNSPSTSTSSIVFVTIYPTFWNSSFFFVRFFPLFAPRHQLPLSPHHFLSIIHQYTSSSFHTSLFFIHFFVDNFSVRSRKIVIRASWKQSAIECIFSNQVVGERREEERIRKVEGRKTNPTKRWYHQCQTKLGNKL